MNLRQLWASFQRWYAAHSERDRRILAGVGVLVALSIVYVVIVEPVIHYRRAVAEEIAEGHERLEHAARFIAAADALRTERTELRQKLDQAKQRLLPGGSGTLGAAALQERANSIAAEKGITVQSTQVMKEEVADPFHKVSIRLTLSGELKPFSEFLAGLEYGPQQLAIPFLEVSRRGAVAGAKGPRTLSATVEVSGYLLGEEAPKPAEGEAPEGEAETASPPGEAEPAPPHPAGDNEMPSLPGLPQPLGAPVPAAPEGVAKPAPAEPAPAPAEGTPTPPPPAAEVPPPAPPAPPPAAVPAPPGAG